MEILVLPSKAENMKGQPPEPLKRNELVVNLNWNLHGTYNLLDI